MSPYAIPGIWPDAWGCASGKHVWKDPASRQLCCNGHHREFRPDDGGELPPGAERVPGTGSVWLWVPDAAAPADGPQPAGPALVPATSRERRLAAAAGKPPPTVIPPWLKATTDAERLAAARQTLRDVWAAEHALVEAIHAGAKHGAFFQLAEALHGALASHAKALGA